MANNIEWKNQKRVAYIISSGIPDAASMQNAEANLMETMKHATAPVHLIWDVQQLDQFPSLIDCIRSFYVKHPRRGWVVVIGLSDKPLFRILVTSLERALHISIKTADSLDQGMALLRELDSSLVDEA